ncbi:HEPN domain-containing protein [Polynucleobacter sp. JS-Safj-400b-B2]|uniref:HEPN domain-containing protein n=1 Tax=Polynucleobacter sp. JS-Safj-400b-B2 TaxID=2576921 RepID=UPI001C0E3817|nr:HEPN domain-containing protein [Polynucleobacter sp. JS-Safj-400b-B2]MBU3626320.1 HEPN domain-containing protein [Polynucleobacter sp. JS-Safj-400b-B2]
MKAKELFAKAQTAAASARILLNAGDVDGACNRAYYAMFDAARAALLASGIDESTVNTKTHSGLISKFSLELVKSDQVSLELGKSLNKVEDLRLMADYKGDAVSEEDAAWAVNQADIFVETLRTTFS